MDELTRRQRVEEEETRAVIERLIRLSRRRDVQCTHRTLAADVESIAVRRLQSVESRVELVVAHQERRVLGEPVGIQLSVLRFEEQPPVVLANVPARCAGRVQRNATGPGVDDVGNDALFELTAREALDADQGDGVQRVRRQHQREIGRVDRHVSTEFVDRGQTHC